VFIPVLVSVLKISFSLRRTYSSDCSVINVFAVEWYGEAEFWLATGKICLLAIVFCFTFITMVGGNPKHDAYGFRYWQNPGSFAEHITTGDLGRFEGFLGESTLLEL
jgi:amino acid transporter